MIIHQPETRRENGEIVVSSRIEHHQDVEFPSELWFSAPEEYESQITARADLFASTLIRVARALETDIEVRGDLSPQLLFGLREYLKVHAAWSGNPNMININANNLVASKRSHPGGVASCNISGGIDSFHTLWSQLPENEQSSDLQVKYGIFGIGLSSPIKNEFIETQYVPNLAKLMSSLGVELLVVRTNAPLFNYRDAWFPISTTRAAIATLFSPLISTHFIPSSVSYKTQRPTATNPLTDHLFSLETLRVFTHAPDLIRFEKLREMSKWSPFYEYLQVCNKSKLDVENDCSCTKCIRSMLMAYVLGIYNEIPTLHIPFHKRLLLRRILKESNQYLDFEMMIKHAKKSGKWSLIPFIIFPMVVYRLTNWIRPLRGHQFR